MVKNRLLLAKLILEDCALLILDEPTNDLDLLTLRALESALLSFEGPFSLLMTEHSWTGFVHGF